METLRLFFTLLPIFSAAMVALYAYRYHVHIFQLNSYHYDVEWNWIGKNLKGLFCLLVPALVVAVLPLFVDILISGAVASAVYLAMLFFFLFRQIKVKAKKPLVFTERVKRLTLTSVLLFLLPAAALCFAGGKWALLFEGSVIGLMPFYIMLTNLINKPIEISVNRYYLNDAKKLLRAHRSLKVIGITGSYGKTSVKYFLTAILSEKYNVLMTPENYNTPMGVVRTVRQYLSPLHEIFVCEMGAKRVGEIKELCDLVHPHDGVITSVGPQHLETFGSQERVRKTKFELARALPRDGTVFLNADSEELVKENYRKNAVYYSLAQKTDYYAENIRTSVGGTAFTLCHGEEREEFTTPLIGRHNVLNIVGALAVAHHYGLTYEEMKRGVKKLKSVPHRLELTDRGRLAIIDDAYNSNPEGAKAALETLAMFDGYKILVTPGMVELGEKMAECNRNFGKQAAEVCDFVILVGKKQAEPIFAGLLEAGYPAEQTYVAETFAEAINLAYHTETGGKKPIILLENDLPDNF